MTQPDLGLDGIFDSFSKLVPNPETASLAPLDSSDVTLKKVIDDHIYGLLTLHELSGPQVALLAALLQTKR